MSSPEAALERPPQSSLLQGLRSTLQKAPDLGAIAGLRFGGVLPEGMRYRAFISYSHRDEKIARWLRKAIESYAVPRDLVGQVTEYGTIPRRLSPIFRDEDELPGAAELGPQLESALRSSGALIVLCSCTSAKSIWVDREIRFFKEECVGRPVLAVIVDGVPGGDEDCFPASLRLSRDDTGALVHDASVEPLAPDLQKQDRQMVKLKLISGLLGVNYNDLYRRDRRRARLRATAFGLLAFVVVAALSTLSIVAVSYARIAVKERNAAQTAQALAERNAEMAERRAWLAQVAATEVRRQTDLASQRGVCR